MNTGRAENTVQILILLLIGGMAGAASFTHVHDWTMHNSPPGTGGWFGWANAVISELTPTAAGLEIRRRRRHHRPVAYPMTVLIAAAALSLTAQVAQARHSPTGWLVAAIPALAFLALTKLILGRPATTPAAQPPDAATKTDTALAPAAVPAAVTLTPDTLRDLRPVPSGQLLISARMTAFDHQQATGQPITPGQLAERLAIPPALAESLIDQLGDAPPPITAVNGTPVHAEGRP